MKSLLPRFALGLSLLLGLWVVLGRSYDARDLPLPGTTVSGPTIAITAEFDDALNLAVGAKVKVDGIDVGRVSGISTRDFRALVHLNIKTAAKVRQGATARLRYNTPLGELFVDVASPPSGRVFVAGDVIKPPNATTAPTVEDTLAQASLLINGGGLNQLQTITTEVQAAVGGRAGTLRQLLERSALFLHQVNSTTANVDRALKALAGASAAVNGRRDVVRQALVDIPPAAQALRANTDSFVSLLERTAALSRNADALVGASRDHLLRLIRQLGPVLDTFYSLRDRFASNLDAFSKTVRLINKTVPGDWVPLDVQIVPSSTTSGLLGSLSGLLGTSRTTTGQELP